MEILSLEDLRNKSFADLANPKIVRFRYVATLDTHVCDYCKDRHGMIIDANSSEYYDFMPPNHNFCRCFWETITSDAPNIPEPDWSNPSDSLISDFAPFLLLLPFFNEQKKNQIIDIQPEYLKIPEVSNNVEDIVKINKFVLLNFLDKNGRSLFDTKVLKGDSLDLSSWEEQLMKKASYYVIDNDVEIPNDLEFEIKQKYGLKLKEMV